MELFHSVNIDWMSKAKYFFALSFTLLAIGAISLIQQHGLRYGIDFRGGTLVYVRFANAAPLDGIRKSLSAEGLGNSTIQTISDVADSNSSNDVVIGLEQKGQGDEALDAGKEAILNACTRRLRPDRGTGERISTMPPIAVRRLPDAQGPIGTGRDLCRNATSWHSSSPTHGTKIIRDY